MSVSILSNYIRERYYTGSETFKRSCILIVKQYLFVFINDGFLSMLLVIHLTSFEFIMYPATHYCGSFQICLISQCLRLYNIYCYFIVLFVYSRTCNISLSMWEAIRILNISSRTLNYKDSPWALLMMIVNANWIGNCNLLDWNGIPVGTIGMMTSSHLKGLVKIICIIKLKYTI